jgi:polyferredoxin
MEDLERDLLSLTILYYFIFIIVVFMGLINTKKQFWRYITPFGLLIFVFKYLKDWYINLEDE